MPARKTIACDVCATVIDFRTADCGSSWEVAMKAGCVYVCRRCTEHEELKTEVIALRELIRELKVSGSKYGRGSTGWDGG